MKIMIPKECAINELTIQELKKEVKKIINEYEDSIYKDLKIYLCKNSLNIVYNKHKYMATIVEYKNDFYWYLKPFYSNYLLIKNTDPRCCKLILSIIISINS